MFVNGEETVDATDSIQESLAQEDGVLVFMPIAKSNYRVTIEPCIMLWILGININFKVQTNLFEERMCLHSALGQNESVNCYNMTAAEQEIIQPAVADLIMVKSVIDTLVPCITALFLGPWSDINGRLPLMLASISGLVICNCMFCVFSTMPGLPPITFLLCSIPIVLTGGNGIFYIASYCYIVDISDSNKRAFRLGILNTFISLGIIIGSVLSPVLFNKSATLAFAVSSTSAIISLLYLSFFVKETVIVKEGANTKLFNINLVKDMWQTVAKKRFSFLRSIIMLSAVVLALNFIVFFGEDSLMYMYLQKQFYWKLENYTLFSAYGTLLSASVPVIGLYIFSTKLQIHDIYLAAAANGLQIIEKVGTAYSSEKWQFYFVKIFGCFVSTSGPLVRSQVSKIFPSEDLGKIFAFISAIEGLGLLLASPIYTTVYNMTILNFSYCIFLLSSIIDFFMLALYLIVIFLLSRSIMTEDLLIEN